jgi:hypothetical protein
VVHPADASGQSACIKWYVLPMAPWMYSAWQYFGLPVRKRTHPSRPRSGGVFELAFFAAQVENRWGSLLCVRHRAYDTQFALLADVQHASPNNAEVLPCWVATVKLRVDAVADGTNRRTEPMQRRVLSMF